jgi:hypothetical protein
MSTMGDLPRDAFGEARFSVSRQMHRANNHATAVTVQFNANTDCIIGKRFNLCHKPRLANHGQKENPLDESKGRRWGIARDNAAS